MTHTPFARMSAATKSYALRQHAEAIARRHSVPVGATAKVDGHLFSVMVQDRTPSRDSETSVGRRVLTIDGALLDEQWHGYQPALPSATPSQWAAFEERAVQVANAVAGHPNAELPAHGRLGRRISRALD